jgi:predicted TIM-barrel fold metal-dependent hydrolase
MHAHVVGTGFGGSGCRLNLRGWRSLMARMMVREVRLPASALKGDLDRLYPEQLSGMLRSSSVRHAVILAQDHVHDDQGRPMPEKDLFYVPNDYVFALAEKYPEMLPAVSIHPARPDAIDELNRCLDRGAVMMKCLPNCQNFNCGDKRFTRFWERMAEAGLPLLAHTGGENTLPVMNPAFANPATLELPLRCGVTVIAAHAGTQSTPADTDYFPVFRSMLDRFPNLYGDASALLLPVRSNRLRECLEGPVVERMVHGSDIPVPIQGIWVWLRGIVSWRDYLRGRKIRNTIERDYQLKLAAGFPPEHFTRVWDLLRLASKPTGGAAT